jgi:hypothetical protein
MTHSKKISLLSLFSFLLIFVSSLCITPVIAQEGQAIGRVLSTTGSVTARDLGGALRELSRRSDIFVGDTVITGPNGFAQLRMVDSAQIGKVFFIGKPMILEELCSAQEVSTLSMTGHGHYCINN